MKLYDTLSQELKEFTPIENNKVKMYVCGPTVYDFPHLGHARCYITWDMVVKYLKFKGFDVTYVRNITDVDDKIINKARDTHSTPKDIAEKFYLEFKDAMKMLNVADPDIEPRATENINGMIDIIKTLVEKGYAYSCDGDVYFRVNKYKKYGKLSKQNIEDLKAGARIETSEKKEDPLDFALWKAVKMPDEISWGSPWGKGRPGWHIECSAMVKRYLGDTIDIHAGGQDLIFPHHENEKAQSEAAFDTTFVKYWLHNGFVTINEEKMSKSLRNFVTIQDVLDDYDANTIRFFILTNNYRMPLEFNKEALLGAKAGVRRLRNAVSDVSSIVNTDIIKEAQNILDTVIDEIVKTGRLPLHNIDTMQYLEEKICPDVVDYVVKTINKFINAMDEDFNTPRALATLFDIAGTAQKAKDAENPEQSAFYLSLLIRLSEVLGFDLTKVKLGSDKLSAELMDVIISVRVLARSSKNWDIADKIRDELAKINITLKDHKDGTTSWSFSE